MKMTDDAFIAYFNKTKLVEGYVVPSKMELLELEQEFINVLEEQKRISQKDGSYQYLYSVNGKLLLGRIGFLNRQVEEGNDTKDVRALLASHHRVRTALRVLDKRLYEREMSTVKQRGEMQMKRKVRERLVSREVQQEKAPKQTATTEEVKQTEQVVPLLKPTNKPVVSEKPNTSDLDKEIYSFEELLGVLRVSRNTLKKWMADGYISYSQPNGSNKVYFQKSDVIAFLENPDIKYQAWK